MDTLRDLGDTDRAEQLAFSADFGGNGQTEAFKLRASGFHFSEMLGCGFLQFGPARLETRSVTRRRVNRSFLGNEKIAGIARLDLDFIAKLAQVFDAFKENDLHAFVP